MREIDAEVHAALRKQACGECGEPASTCPHPLSQDYLDQLVEAHRAVGSDYVLLG